MTSTGYYLQNGARLLAYVAVARDTTHLSERARAWLDFRTLGPCHESRFQDSEGLMSQDPLLSCIAGYATGIVERRGERYHVHSCQFRSCVEGALIDELNETLGRHSGPIAVYDDSAFGADFLPARMFAAGFPLSADANGQPQRFVDLARYVASSFPSAPVPLYVATELLGMGHLGMTPTIAELTRSYHAMIFAEIEAEVFRRLHSTALIHSYLETDGALPFVQVEVEGSMLFE